MMNHSIECSCLSQHPEELIPQHLLCACCLKGGGEVPVSCRDGAQKALDLARSAPDCHVKLISAFDEAGARNARFYTTTPQERKRDLDILQKLGLTPETVRTPRVLYELLARRIPSPIPICGQCVRETDTWHNCPLVKSGAYENGLREMIPQRTAAEKCQSKQSSCARLQALDAIPVRAHHLLCMLCIAGSAENLTPLEEDNLVELLMRILENPSVPIILKEGPGECMVCPPCHAFDQKTGLCVVSMSLRDRRKDLTVLERIGCTPEDTLPAKELLSRILQNIPQVAGLCIFDQETSFEWASCQMPSDDVYEKGLTRVCRALKLLPNAD